MGIITIEKSDNLFWLGRYTERVHTTLKYYIEATDRMIDTDPDYYTVLCQKIGIPDVYGSREKFFTAYPFDTADPNSIFSNLYRAYDNAIVMRDYIGTETMAYIQLAIDDMKAARRGDAPLADLMMVIDHTMAFWGCVDDRIDDEQTRNIIKLGKGIERLDLYLSIGHSEGDIRREYARMKQYLRKSHIHYDESILYTIDTMLSEYAFSYESVRNLIRNLITA